MVKYCPAYGCNNYSSTPGLSFHRVPADQSQRKRWIAALKLEKQLKWNNTYICSAHFTPDSFDNLQKELGFRKYNRLKKDAVPSIFSFRKHEEDRFERKRRLEESGRGPK